MVDSKLPKIFYGGDYNPEQWPENIWLEDMDLMKQAGVNLVSVGIFSWASLQSDDGSFHFEWLDRVLNLLSEKGIYAALATATASPPPWISRKYPDMLPVDAQGNRISYGSRQSYCPNSPDYRRLSQALVRKIAERYHNHPALLLWHVNNEYACHNFECYCENCAAAFRDWLRRKYGSIDELNAAWGCNFWSQRYYQWEEIIPPRATSTFPNPGQVLDYRRFLSDSFLECYLGEIKILRELTPEIPVTTNFMADFNQLNYFEWARHVDVVAWDCYPDPVPGYHPAWAGLNHDLMRSLRAGQPFILMEQAPSQVNWRPINPNKRPGIMRLWSYQALARGADGIMFFQWRQSLKGAEKFHSAMVTHTGDGNSRVFKEVSQLGRELAGLDEIIDSRCPAKVGILFDYDNWWAVEYKQRPHENLKYLEQIHDYYDPLFEMNIPVDLLPVTADFSRYQLIIAPLLYMVKPGLAEGLENYVAKGGTLVTTFFSGIVDETGGVFPGGYPGPLKELLGIKVEEFDPLVPEMRNEFEIQAALGDLSGKYPCHFWCDVVIPGSAKALASFTMDYYSGCPAITENCFGEGKAYYIATRPEHSFLKSFLKNLCQTNLIEAPFPVPEGVELRVRTKGDRQYLFLMNHNDSGVELELPAGRYYDLVGKKDVAASLSLMKYGAMVLRVSEAER